MSDDGKIHVSQDYEVLEPGNSKAYPIPLFEWNNLKNEIQKCSIKFDWFQFFGSTAIGAFLGLFISAFTAIEKYTVNQKLTSEFFVAVTVGIALSVVGVLAICFSSLHRKDVSNRSERVISQMDLIEKRYPQVGQQIDATGGTSTSTDPYR